MGLGACMEGDSVQEEWDINFGFIFQSLHGHPQMSQEK